MNCMLGVEINSSLLENVRSCSYRQEIRKQKLKMKEYKKKVSRHRPDAMQEC